VLRHLPTRPWRAAILAALTIAALAWPTTSGWAAHAGPRASPAALSNGGVFVVLQTDPDGTAGSFSLTHNVGSNSSPVVPSPFSLVDGQARFFNSVVPGTYTITLHVPDGWNVVRSGDGYDTGCWDDQDNSTIDVSSGTASLNVGPGEFIVCTFVVRQASVAPWTAHVTLLSEPRGIGYWRNRGGCLESGDSELATSKETAFVRRALQRGSPIYPLGTVSALTCAETTRLLWKVDFDGTARANDAAYNLVAQLLAAKLNKAAGVPVPACVRSAMDSSDQLLTALNFSGRGPYLGPGSNPQRGYALQLADLLDRYTNADSAVLANNCG
jgi:hypothetical protein